MPEADAEHGADLPVGEYLRRTRESRGLQLEEASRVTKIGKNYLVAIEEGQFDKLPNAAYIKGFLRLYAGFLSLSGDEVVRRYEQNAAPQGPARPPVEAKPEQPSVQIMERAKLGGRGRWVIPVLLLALVILAALFMTESEDKRVRPAAKPVEHPAAAPAQAPVQPQRTSAVLPGAAQQTAPTPAPTAVQPPASAPAPAAPTSVTPAPAKPASLPPTPGSSTVPAAPAATTAPARRAAPAGAGQPAQARRGGVVLRLRFNQDSWLSITIDDSISQRYDLKAGDVIEWKGSRSFVIDIGDGAAAEAEFNGRRLKALGEPGKPAHLELKGE